MNKDRIMRRCDENENTCPTCAQHVVNTRWLMDKIDQIHDMLCPDHLGTWQQRAEEIVRVVKRRMS
jgi:hypothetical protein